MIYIYVNCTKWLFVFFICSSFTKSLLCTCWVQCLLLHAMKPHQNPSPPMSLVYFHWWFGHGLPGQKSVLSGTGFDSPLVLPTAILTPPRMEITMDGFHLLIKLEDLGPHFEFFVSYWRREPGAKVRLAAWAFELVFGEALRTGWGRPAPAVPTVWGCQRMSRPGWNEGTERWV